MAASANPSGNQDSPNAAKSNSPLNNGVKHSTNGTAAPAPDNSPAPATQSSLKHNPGAPVHWSSEEQSILDDLLAKYASESSLLRYAKIAMQLKDKTVRDVAMRCRWLSRKEFGKRRKEDHNASRKNKDKKEKVMDSSAKSSSHLASRPNGTPYTLPVIPMDNDDGISYKAIGGVPGQLLEQNAQVFNQISVNFGAYNMHENIGLFCQTRDNIIRILNSLNDMPEVMKQMPPLPVKVNEELANSILPRSSVQLQS